MARGGGRSGGGSRSSHSSSRGMTSGRGGGRSFGSTTRSAGWSSGGLRTHRGGAGFGGPGVSGGSRKGGSRSGGGYSGRPTPPPARPRVGFGGYRRRPVFWGGYRGGAPYGGGASYGGGGCAGCLSSLVLAVVALALLAVLLPASCLAPRSSSSGGTTSSSVAQVTHTHEKLPASECDVSDEWLSDRAEWIDDEAQVVRALKYFYNKTGSQPYLVVATDVDGKTDFTDAEGEAWANAIYDEHFSDDGHTVVAFVEYAESEYAYYIVAGRAAQAVIDQEAREIIADEINYWYTDASLDDSAYFAKVFTESADTIMFDYEQTTSTANTRKRTVVLVLGAAAVAGIVGVVFVNASRRKKEEYEAAQKLAQTPVGGATPPAPTVSSPATSAGTPAQGSVPQAEPAQAASSTLAELEAFERKYGTDDDATPEG